MSDELQACIDAIKAQVAAQKECIAAMAALRKSTQKRKGK